MAVQEMTAQDFKEKIFDYENESEWNYKGDKPVVLDFYADWCAPCKQTGPILEEISEERDDIDIYSVDVEQEQELAGAFGIQSIPTFIFIPTEGKPASATGALPKETFNEAIEKTINGETE